MAREVIVGMGTNYEAGECATCGEGVERRYFLLNSITALTPYQCPKCFTEFLRKWRPRMYGRADRLGLEI